MADKRISQLVDRGTVANNDVVPIVVSGATTTNKATISSIQTFMQGNLDLGVTSVGITLGSSGTDVNVTGSPITTSGNITINIPTASATARGLVSTAAQTFAGTKTFVSDIVANGVNVGKGAGTGADNVRVGENTLIANTTGANNTAVGARSLQTNSIGQNNTAIGLNSLQSNAGGSNNTSVGLGSLNFNTSGSNNVAVGTDAGKLTSTSTTLLIANNSIFIGEDTRANASNETNQIVIGDSAVGRGSNTVTIGNSSITSNRFFGRVIHADAVNADESATLGQVNTTLGGFVTLGTAQTITAQKTFSTSGSSDTMIISHGSGSGIALDVIKAGNGQAIRVQKTSGSGDAVTITGDASITGAFSVTNSTSTFAVMNSTNANGGVLTFRRNGTNVGHIGNSAQLGGGVLDAIEVRSGVGSSVILRSDGGQLTLATGGAVTLTGALNGTSAVFSVDDLNTIFVSNPTTSGATTGSGIGFRAFNGTSVTQSAGIILTSNTWSFGTYLANQLSVGSDGTGGIALRSANSAPIRFYTGGSTAGLSTQRLEIASTGAATFSSSVTAASLISASSINSGTLDFGTSALKGVIDYSAGSGLFKFNNQTSGSLPTLYYQFQADGSPIMSMLKNGNVGIGTATPGQKLTLINGTFQIGGTSTFSDNIEIGRVGGDNNMAFATGGTERMRISSGGSVGIGTATPGVALDVRVNSGIIVGVTSRAFIRQSAGGDAELGGSTGAGLFLFANNVNALSFSGTTATFAGLGTGTVSATSGTLSTVSDSSYKVDDGFIDSALDKVLNLKPRYFYWNEKSGLPTDIRQLGFYAQEVNEALGEEAANTPQDENTSWGIMDRSVIAMLTKAIQEQQEQINQLKNQIK